MSLFGNMSYRCDETIVYDYDETGTFLEMMQCASQIMEEMVKNNSNSKLENDFQYVKLFFDRMNCKSKDLNIADLEGNSL